VNSPPRRDSQFVSEADFQAMAAALEQARLALAVGEVPVGAVVLSPAGAVIGAGHNLRQASNDPAGHAEVLALRQAGQSLADWQLTGCTLVVTLEPCTMCAGALVQARIRRLVFGAWDEKAGAVGSLWDVVRDRRLNHRPDVLSGVREAECARLLTEFFADRR
jgi:tRNA(adenine34) deaminase